MPKFIRFKQSGMQVLEIDISTIRVLSVEMLDNGESVLTAYSDLQEFDLCYGTVDECHWMLNQLHDALNIDIIDL